MRPIAAVFAIFCLAAFSALAWMVGAGSTERIEQATRSQTGAALKAAGETWAKLEIDGLNVRLSGEAPGEAEHLHALEVLGRLLSARRIEDTSSIAPAAAAEAPVFHLEILRTGENVSLIGRVPSDPGSAPIIAAIEAIPGIASITDLLETADASPAGGWQEAIEFGLGSIAEINQGRIILSAGSADIATVADSSQQKDALSTALRSRAPDDLALNLDITAPLPVIAPFLFALDLDAAGGPSLSACTAATSQGRTRILSAAQRAGADAPLDCRLGLGAPSLLWPRAVDLGVAALEQMRGGTLQIVDTELRITAPPGLARDAFEALTGDLREALPAPFTLQATAPESPVGERPASAPPVFIAELATGGAVRLNGPVHDRMSDNAITTYAASLFGYDKVSGSLSTRPDLPEGWPGRILTGLETLSLLENGRVEITAETMSLSGVGASEDISLEVRDTLRLRLGGEGISVNVRFDPALVPPEEPALHPAQCEIRIASVLETSQIAFAPNAVEIEDDSLPVIDAIADILRQCKQTRFEIGGHTDNQGREVMNMGLSQSRADAVLDALLKREVLIAELTARGYGESQPIAPNDTEEGRRKNRRIAFKLLEDPDGSD